MPLAEPLSDAHRRRLDDLLKRRDNGKTTGWRLRQSPVKPNSRHMLEHIERLKAWQALDLPSGIERSVHQNRLLKIAREGGQMTPADRPSSRRSDAMPPRWRLPSRAWPPSPTKSSTCTTASRASCSTPPRTSISSNSGRPARRSTPKVRLFGRIGGR